MALAHRREGGHEDGPLGAVGEHIEAAVPFGQAERALQSHCVKEICLSCWAQAFAIRRGNGRGADGGQGFRAWDFLSMGIRPRLRALWASELVWLRPDGSRPQS